MNNEIKLPQLINKHKNKSCIIVGGGHTMHDFNYKDFKGLIIVLGTAILKIENKIKPDYLVTSNSEFPIPEFDSNLKVLNKNKKMIWLNSNASTYAYANKINPLTWTNKIKIKYYIFDDLHFKNKKCRPLKPCCEHIKPNIWEKFYKICKYRPNYFYGGSVASLGIMFAILFGCKKIFLQGVDLPHDKYGQENKYYGYNNFFASKIIHENRKKLKKKIFFHNLKNMNFNFYLKELLLKVKTKFFKQSYWKTYGNIKRFNKIYRSLADICKKKKILIYVLSNKSTLLKFKYYKFVPQQALKKLLIKKNLNKQLY